MPDNPSNTYHVTLKEETINELRELFPAALDDTEAIRMAVDAEIHRRKTNLSSENKEE